MKQASVPNSTLQFSSEMFDNIYELQTEYGGHLGSIGGYVAPSLDGEVALFPMKGLSVHLSVTVPLDFRLCKDD